MTARVILACAEEDITKIYLDSIKPLGIQVDTVPSIMELHRSMIQNPYSGILIDLKTKIKADRTEKEITHNVLDLYPVIQLTYDQKSESIKTLYFGQAKGNGTIESFLKDECLSFKARTIRISQRRETHFNVMLSKEDVFSESEEELTVTIDISKGGCFLYSIDDWKNREKVNLSIKELEDSSPIRGEVRWIRSWGKAMEIPGIGVRFEDISREQFEEICTIGNLF